MTYRSSPDSDNNLYRQYANNIAFKDPTDIQHHNSVNGLHFDLNAKSGQGSGDFSKQRPFSYAADQFSNNFNQSIPSDQQLTNSNLKLSDPYLSNKINNLSAVADLDEVNRCHYMDDNACSTNLLSGGSRGSANILISDSPIENLEKKLIDDISHKGGSNNHRDDDFIDIEAKQNNQVAFIANNSSDNCCSLEFNKRRSSCILGNCIKIPCLSVWLGIFMIAEIIAFCIISSGFVSGSLAQIQQQVWFNETLPSNEIRGFYSAVLSLIALLHVIAIIAHVLVATAVAKFQYNCFDRNDQCLKTCDVTSCDKCYKLDNGIQTGAKRQILKNVCFRIIQLFLMFSFFTLFVSWLVVSMLFVGLLGIVIIVPYMVFSCGENMVSQFLLNLIQLTNMRKGAESHLQSLFMNYCLNEHSQEKCDGYRNLVCNLSIEWNSAVPLMLGCCLLLVVSIVMTLCCQSVNFGCSSQHLTTNIKRRYLQKFKYGGGRNQNSSNMISIKNDPQNKAFDRVLAELEHKDNKSEKASNGAIRSDAACESNGVLL